MSSSADNFHYEQKRLENDLVALEIFNPSVHVASFLEVVKTRRDVFNYVAFPSVQTEEEFRNAVFKPICESPKDCLYAIIDKTVAPEDERHSWSCAGVVSLMATDPDNAATEMGIIIFPPFQRTHVSSNAMGLLLLYLLDPPSAGGLGLRRVVWQCHAGNAASRRVAERMGFELEGIARWERTFPQQGAVALSADALQKRNGTEGELPGRHTAVYSIVWDEWDDKRGVVASQMQRTT